MMTAHDLTIGVFKMDFGWCFYQNLKSHLNPLPPNKPSEINTVTEPKGTTQGFSKNQFYSF